MLNTKGFYEQLREEDMEMVRVAVDELKAKGFEVYITDESFNKYTSFDLPLNRNSLYDDEGINLVAKPKRDTSESQVRAGLDEVVESLRLKGANEVPDIRIRPNCLSLGPSFLDFRASLLGEKPTYAGSELIDRAVVLFARVLEPHSPKLPEVLMGHDNVDNVDAYKKYFGNRKIDISVSYEPFALNPQAKCLQL